MHESWVSGSRVRPSVAYARPNLECEWAAPTTSGRAWWMPEWMANAAWLTGQSPSTTSPWWFTRIRSSTVICLKLMPSGLTQKWSRRSGSRAVMWPATPSSKPNCPNSRKAAARRCLRWRRSSAGSSNFGNLGGTRSDAIVRWYSDVHPAIHADDLPGDVAGGVGAQERARGGDVGGCARTTERHHRSDDVDAREVALRLGGARHRRVDEARRDRVHRDPAA